MIEVKVQSYQDIISLIEVKGHADSAPHGEDLVCAAVSAIVTGGCNAIHEVNKFQIKMEEGYVLIKAKGNVTRADALVLQTIVKQLETIEDSYPQYIRIRK